jgi:hypothetical protein
MDYAPGRKAICIELEHLLVSATTKMILFH